MTFKKGDLVMVVRPTPCCGDPRDIGRVEVIREVDLGVNWTCALCDADHDGRTIVLFEVDGVSACQAIKINPPAGDTEEVADKELEGVV